MAIIRLAEMTQTDGYTWKMRLTLLEDSLFSQKDMCFTSHIPSTQPSQPFHIFNCAANKWTAFKQTTNKQNYQITRFQEDWQHLLQERQRFFQGSDEAVVYEFASVSPDISWICKSSTLAEIFGQEQEEQECESTHQLLMSANFPAMQIDNEELVLQGGDNDISMLRVNEDTDMLSTSSDSDNKTQTNPRKKRKIAVLTESSDNDADLVFLQRHSINSRIFVNWDLIRDSFHLIGIVQRATANAVPAVDRYFLLVESHNHRVRRLQNKRGSEVMFDGHCCALVAYDSCLESNAKLYCIMLSCVILAKWFDPWIPKSVVLNPADDDFKLFLQPYLPGNVTGTFTFDEGSWHPPLEALDEKQSYIFSRCYSSTELTFDEAEELLERMMTLTRYLHLFLDCKEPIQLVTRGELFKLQLNDFRDFGYDVGLETVLTNEKIIRPDDEQAWDAWEQREESVQCELKAGTRVVDIATLDNFWHKEREFGMLSNLFT